MKRWKRNWLHLVMHIRYIHDPGIITNGGTGRNPRADLILFFHLHTSVPYPSRWGNQTSQRNLQCPYLALTTEYQSSANLLVKLFTIPVLISSASVSR